MQTTQKNQSRKLSDKLEFNALFEKLKTELGDQDRCQIFIGSKEKATLIKTRGILEPEWSYEYPFFWNNLVVNANWLSHSFSNIVVLYSVEHYKKINPNNNPIND